MYILKYILQNIKKIIKYITKCSNVHTKKYYKNCINCKYTKTVCIFVCIIMYILHEILCNVYIYE